MGDIEKWLNLLQAAGGWGAALILLKLLLSKDKDYKALVKSHTEESKEQAKQIMDFAIKSTDHIAQQTANTVSLKEAVKELADELRTLERAK